MIVSRIIESATYCNQKLLALLYLNSTQMTSVNWIIRLLLSLLCYPKVILLTILEIVIHVSMLHNVIVDNISSSYILSHLQWWWLIFISTIKYKIYNNSTIMFTTVQLVENGNACSIKSFYKHPFLNARVTIHYLFIQYRIFLKWIFLKNSNKIKNSNKNKLHRVLLSICKCYQQCLVPKG